MYKPYVTPDEYADLGYNDICAKELPKYLRDASRQIDSLTFNRIIHYGFDNLTEFQKDIIQTVVCEQANFLEENKDGISSILSKYSINGVTMDFSDSINIVREQGIPMEKTIYSLLKQTGLCCRLAR